VQEKRPTLLVLSTDVFPERDRFEYWREQMFTQFGFTPQVAQERCSSYQGSATLAIKEPLRYARINGEGFVATRGRREIASITARDGYRIDSYRLYRERGSGVIHRIGDREIVTSRGDLLFDDAANAFEARTLERIDLESWLIPKDIVEPHLPKGRRPMRLPQTSGLTSLAASYLTSLWRNRENIRAEDMVGVADALGRLIAIACGAAEAEHPVAVQSGRLAQAKAYINVHLADPELTPTQVAMALQISLRALHASFEPTGVSCARYVLRRRLEECRVALLANSARPVTDIAFAWGFGTLSGFYHAFSSAFGMSPGDLRAAARERGDFPGKSMRHGEDENLGAPAQG
jgi:AraC-like DNA-binding protein